MQYCSQSHSGDGKTKTVPTETADMGREEHLIRSIKLVAVPADGQTGAAMSHDKVSTTVQCSLQVT